MRLFGYLLSHLLRYMTFLFSDSNWILGEQNETCDVVCAKRNRVCNSDEQSKLTNEELLKSAMLKAGQLCKSVVGPRDYPGTPFYVPSTGTCAYLKKGLNSVCDRNRLSWHSPLCYCGKLLTITIFQKLQIIFVIKTCC